MDRTLSIQKTDRVPLGQLALQKESIDNKLTYPNKTGPEFILGFGVKTLDI